METLLPLIFVGNAYLGLFLIIWAAFTKNKRVTYFTMLSWSISMLAGAFYGGASDMEAGREFDPLFYILLFGGALLFVSAIRLLQGKPLLPRFITETPQPSQSEKEKSFSKKIIQKVIIGVVTFLITSVLSIILFDSPPQPSLKIGGTFSLVSVVISFAFGD